MNIKYLLPRLAVLGAALIWGGAFIVMKDVLTSIPTFWLLAIRFCLAGILLSAISYKKLKLLDVSYWKDGMLLGFFLAMAYGTQTIGLSTTTPGKNAFLTAGYCVLVPFMNWLVIKQRPRINHLIAAIICILGIGLISLSGDTLTISRGDAFSAICAVFFALHITGLDVKSKKQDIVLLTITQFFCCSLVCFVIALFTEQPPQTFTTDMFFSFVYLILFSTIGCMLFQAYGQKNAAPTEVAVLMSFESVFAAIFSLMAGMEVFNPVVVCGFAVTFVAVVIAQLPAKK